MKRELTSTKGAAIKTPEAPRSEERQFGNDIQRMVELMASQFKNQTLLELNKSTVDKFADAQVGNFASVYLKLADKIRRKLVKRFSDDRLKKLADKYTSKVDRRSQKLFYSRIESAIGISAQELENTEGLTSTINAYKLETYQWLRKMRDDTMQEWTSNTLRAMAEGETLEQVLSQFDGMVEKRKNHAKMVARTQISTFNSLTNKIRAQNLGIEKAVWVTSRDERVRSSHAARDGKEFDLSEGLYSSTDGKTLLPGVDYQCRCDYRMVIPKMED